MNSNKQAKELNRSAQVAVFLMLQTVISLAVLFFAFKQQQKAEAVSFQLEQCHNQNSKN